MSNNNNDNLTKKANERLPKNWIKNRSKKHKDRFYYFNIKTGETQWHPPTINQSLYTNPSTSAANNPSSSTSPRSLQLKQKILPIIQDKTPAQNRLNAMRKVIADKPKTPSKETGKTSQLPSSLTKARNKSSIPTTPKKLFEPSCATSLITKSFKIPKLNPVPTTATGDTKSVNNSTIQQETTKTETDFIVPKKKTVVHEKSSTLSSELTNSSNNSLDFKRDRKRKFDDDTEAPSSIPLKKSTSLSDRLKRIQEECRAKDSPAVADTQDKNQSTNNLLINPESLSEQKLSEIRAKIIFQLNNDETLNHPDQSSDLDDVSMKTESSLSSASSSSCEEMDWEEIVLDEISVVRDKNYVGPSSSSSVADETPVIDKHSNDLQLSVFTKEKSNNLYIVIDTNVFLHDLQFVRNLLLPKNDKRIKEPIIIIPYIVLQELDKLKMRTNNEVVSIAASQTVNYINHKFCDKKENSNLFGQSSLDDGNHLISIDSADDRILNCCLQFFSKGYKKNLVLLSNDVNLRNKALVSGIEAVSHRKLNLLLN